MSGLATLNPTLAALMKAWKSLYRAEEKWDRAVGWQALDKATRSKERAEARLRSAQTAALMEVGDTEFVRLNGIAEYWAR